MTNITLSVSEELKKQMSELPEINWSVVAREAIKEKIAKLSLLKSISAKSQLTQKDALELGRKINKSLHERYKDESGN
jgi:hypothetical protein